MADPKRLLISPNVHRFATQALVCGVLWTLVFLLPICSNAQSMPPASLMTADGKSLQGEIIRIDDDGVHFNESSGPNRGSEAKVFAIEELSQIRWDHAGQTPLPMQVQLAGGSIVRATVLNWSDETVTVTPARQSPIELPVQQLRWVRFRAGNTATDPTWLGWLEEVRRGDRLIVRRNEKALDSIDGTALAINRDSVEFETRGNRVIAPLSKLEGLMLSTRSEDTQSSSIRLSDTSGSIWAAESIRMSRDAEMLRIRLSGSIEHEIPIDQVSEIWFAGGILPLAEAEIAEAVMGTETVSPSAPDSVADLGKWFSPQTDEGVIAMNAPAKITFRIPEGYQKLMIAARRDRDVHQFTAVQLEVLLDDESKWTGILKDRESLGLDLDLAGARQLTLRAAPLNGPANGPANDASTTATLGGQVQWFSGRLLK